MPDTSAPQVTLTPREFELHELITTGKSRKEIADLMGVSPPRVSQLALALRTKMGIAPAPAPAPAPARAATPYAAAFPGLTLDAAAPPAAPLPTPKLKAKPLPELVVVRQIAERQRYEPTFTWVRAGREMGIPHARLAKARLQAHADGSVPLPPCDLPCDMMTMCRIINRWGLAVSDALAYGAKNPQTVKDLMDASTLMEAIYEGTADPFAASMISSFSMAAGRVTTLAQNDRAAEARARALDKLRPPAAVNGVALPMLEDHPARRMQEIMAAVIPQLLADNDERKAREARERQG